MPDNQTIHDNNNTFEELIGGVDFSRTYDADEARQYCSKVARSHYENFKVVSWLLPRELHQHFYNIYSYCRWADDLADEITNHQGKYDLKNRQRSYDLLSWWRTQLMRVYEGDDVVPSSSFPVSDNKGQNVPTQDAPLHPVMIALSETIERFSIPKEPFLDLLWAFEQDQQKQEYETYEELLNYCRCSANPVGRLVLCLFGVRDPVSVYHSDCVCTGLQLANFWQDVYRDFCRGRIYLPREDRALFGYTDDQLHRNDYNDAFRKLMQFEVDRTHDWFLKGYELVDRVPWKVQIDTEMFIRAGVRILKKIEKIDFDLWAQRPVLTRSDKAMCMVRSAGQFLWKRSFGKIV